jgi:Flp pilus assembly pilin Flp
MFSGDQTLKPPLYRAAIQDGSTTRRGKLCPARRVSLRCDHPAVTAVEYAVIAGVMVFVVLTVTGPFWTGLSNLLAHAADAL